MIRSVIMVVALTGLLAGCDDSYEDQVDKLTRHVSDSQIGSGADFWLVKGSFGLDDRIALVFGYMDDQVGCSELADMLNERYPSAQYSCRPAN